MTFQRVALYNKTFKKLDVGGIMKEAYSSKCQVLMTAVDDHYSPNPKIYPCIGGYLALGGQYETPTLGVYPEISRRLFDDRRRLERRMLSLCCLK